MASKTADLLPLVVLIVIGLAVALAGVAIYLQGGSSVSQLPSSPGIPANPDFVVGIICMGLGAALMIAGVVLGTTGVLGGPGRG